MSYQLAFAIYLIVTTINALLARRYAVQTTLHPLVSGILTNATIALPFALTYALMTEGLLAPSLSYAAIALVEGVAGTSYGVLALYAQKHNDATTFATLIKTHVLIVIAASSLFIGESLSAIQLLGATLLILSGILLSKGISRRHLALNLVSVVLLSMVVILGRIMVLETSVGMALVTSTIIGLLIKLIFKGKEFRRNFTVIRAEYRQKATLSVFTFAQILLFTLSADLSGNVSLISSLASVKVITVMIASYIFLGERSNLERKALASLLSVFGLLLI